MISLLLLLQDEFVNEKLGFRISRPDASWAFSEPSPPTGAKYALLLQKSGAMVTVYLADTDVKTAEEARKKRVEALRKDGINSKEGEIVLAGMRSPWVRFDYEAGGTRYRLQQHYLANPGGVFIVQTAASPDQFDARSRDFAAILKTFTFLSDKERPPASLDDLAAKCGSEIAWARDWDDAAARARKEKKLIFVVVWSVSGFKVHPGLLLMNFTEPELTDLINERFVPLLYTKRDKAPFHDPAVYGMGPSFFGAGLLFATPEGKIVAETYPLGSGLWIDDYSRRLLAKLGGTTGNTAESCLKRGEVDLVLEMLASPTSAREWRLRATALRRLRKGDDALQAIAKARAAGGPEADLAADEALTHLHMGKAEESQFSRWLEKNAKHARSPEMRFSLAMLKMSRAGFAAAKADLEKIAREHADSPWAWRAAVLLVESKKRDGSWGKGADLAWPAEALFEAARDAKPDPLTDLDRVRAGAVKVLLSDQRADGSWGAPFYVSQNPGMRVAITALAASALIPYRTRPDVEPTFDRALEHLLALDPEKAMPKDMGTAFDMSGWGYVSLLRFFARCSKEKIGDRAKLVRRMNEIVKGLKDRQTRAGGWGYASLEEVGGASDPAMTFMTAWGVLALVDAKAGGATVPQEMIDRAGEFVVRARGEDGTYGYSGNARKGGAEASLRSPLCALAARRAGKADLEEIRAALGAYLQFHAHTRKERGKVVCHTGPEGTASYYLLYGYAFASEAIRELPEKERAKYREALVDDVLNTRGEDGSFRDSPVEGRAYGSAMGLLALEE
jgi:hypothetical protein